MKRMTILASGLVCLATACGGGDKTTCDPAANTGCDNGLVCENVTGGDPACFDPVVMRGDVIDLGNQSAIAGANVVALDIDRSAVSDVATTGADGKYELRIPETRAADGTPTGVQVTLRADATGYQTFPGGVRTALPVDLSTAAQSGGSGPWVVMSQQTQIGLFADPNAGTGKITGHVELPDGVGAIVVAETGSPAVGHDAVVAHDGAFSILNLSAGDYVVSAYSPGIVHDTASVTLAAGGTQDVTLHQTSATAPSVSGSVQIVNGNGFSSTSIVMFVESTFDPSLMRGAAPPAIQADNISGAFTIDGVPPGNYVVLAAFPNDGLVRDPDTCISGTAIVHTSVADQPVTISSGFKVTGALAMISPADGASVAGGVPTFTWMDDSGEDTYNVSIDDSFGTQVWSKSIPGVSGTNPTVTYDGAQPLPSGMFYQFHVTSLKQGCELAASEDLAGVFYVP